LRERAGVADELDRPGGDREPALVVPYGGAGCRGQPAPAQGVLYRQVVVGERPSCSQQCRGRGGASLGDEKCKAVEQQVERKGCARSRGEGLDGTADVQEDVAFGVVPGADGLGPGFLIRLAG
jgi:hypothetical protein